MKGHRKCGNTACGYDVPGPRSRSCPKCGYTFPAKAGTVVSEDGDTIKVVKVARLPDGYDIPDDQHIETVNTPRGYSPIPLNIAEASDEDILNWAMDVRQTLLNEGVYLTNSALGYWAAQFVPMDKRNTVAALRRVIQTLPDVTYREVPA